MPAHNNNKEIIKMMKEYYNQEPKLSDRQTNRQPDRQTDRQARNLPRLNFIRRTSMSKFRDLHFPLVRGFGEFPKPRRFFTKEVILNLKTCCPQPSVLYQSPTAEFPSVFFCSLSSIKNRTIDIIPTKY